MQQEKCDLLSHWLNLHHQHYISGPVADTHKHPLYYSTTISMTLNWSLFYTQGTVLKKMGIHKNSNKNDIPIFKKSE
jgi:hypothetical protein